MTTLTVDLPPELVDRLHLAAKDAGQPLDALITRLLAEQFQVAYRHPDVVPAPENERERVRAVLRTAGLQTELGPMAQRLADESTGTLEDVEAAFAQADGKPLSEIVLEMRGPKE